MVKLKSVDTFRGGWRFDGARHIYVSQSGRRMSFALVYRMGGVRDNVERELSCFVGSCLDGRLYEVESNRIFSGLPTLQESSRPLAFI